MDVIFIMKQLYRVLLIMMVFGLTSCATTAPIQKPPESIKNQFQAVWNEVISDPLNKLPQEKVSYTKLVKGGKNVILGNSRRTFKEPANILKPFDKLAHPNGICFAGTWNIHANNKFSGYFKKGSKALMIVRASTAMSNTKRGQLRAFGFAGKIFPTMNPKQVLQDNTANFFLIDDLGGTRVEHYTDVALTNEPSTSITSAVLKSFLYVIKVARTFSQVDKNPSIRQVYEISELGESNKADVITPRWMKVEAKQGQTVDEDDFRNELKIAKNEKLVFTISVASEEIDNKKDWKNIGTITLDTSVVSKSCDHRLHFHHPKWKSNLKH